MLTVWAIDPGRVRRGMLVPLSCTAVLLDADVGTFQVTIPADDPLSQRVVEGWRVLIQDDGDTILSGPIESITGELGDDTRGLTGVSDLVHVQDRRTYPTPNQEATSQTAEAKYKATGPAETVIRDLIHANVGTGAIVSRRQDGFTVTASESRGATVSAETRFEPVLEHARKLARLGGVTFDAVQEQDNRIVCRFRVPVDRSRAVRFSQPNGGLSTGSYGLAAPTATVAIVGGMGEGTYRNIRQYTRATSWGRRVETFVDQSSSDDDTELKQAGTEALDEGAEGATASISVNESPGRRFGTDFFLGDTVTVELGAATISEPVRQVALTWDGHGRTAELTLGDHESADDKTPKWFTKIKKLDARLRAKEAT